MLSLSAAFVEWAEVTSGLLTIIMLTRLWLSLSHPAGSIPFCIDGLVQLSPPLS